MRFCPLEKCEHYTKATKYPRKCYYEPQCWKGWLDLFFGLIILRFSKKGQLPGEGVKDEKEGSTLGGSAAPPTSRS